jgi:hypothetical protein
MELLPGQRFAHGGIESGAYYVFDGTAYRYVDNDMDCEVMLTGIALSRDDWYRVVEDDDALATQLEQEASQHIAQFRTADEVELSIAAGYSNGLERAARLLRERSRW